MGLLPTSLGILKKSLQKGDGSFVSSEAQSVILLKNKQ
jgi:hypothetical protein